MLSIKIMAINIEIKRASFDLIVMESASRNMMSSIH